MVKKVEVLSPVGGHKSLKEAVENGADAVYFGVGKFNARRRAESFSVKQLRDAVAYAHDNGVRAYGAFNILIKNSELREFFYTISNAYASGIDGIIIQHISFARILKDTFPDLRIHMSTQAGITNTYFSKLLYGADRVTIPREFSLAELIYFIDKIGLETEVFVHGALCFCYSGQCLFSSLLGGRSGNRGVCAQPCRKRYNDRYMLSTKDLCLAGRIPEIIKVGVTSLKIEGRLKSPQYTALATRVYRLSVDSYYAGNFKLPEQELKELALVFNREFTEGYMFGAPEIIANDSPKNRGLFLGLIEEDTMITLHEDLAVSDGISIWTKNGIDGAVINRLEKDGGSVASASIGERVKLFVRADTGDRIYKTSSQKKPKYAPLKPKPKIDTPARKKQRLQIPELEKTESDGLEILAKVYSKEDAMGASRAGADYVFYSIFAHDFQDADAFPYIPRILSDSNAKHAISMVKDSEAVLLGNCGFLSALSGSKIYLDYSANVFNDIDLAFVTGAVPIISPELNCEELQEFANKNFAVLLHGRPVLMTTKYPLKARSLKDERGFAFPVRKEFHYTQILNSLPIGIFNDINLLLDSGINKFFLDLTDGNAEKLIRLYRYIMDGKPVKKSVLRKHTQGHFNRGV